MVKARQCEKGDEGAVGGSRATGIHYALAAAATAGLSVAGFEVARILASLLQNMQTPALLATVASGTVVSLFAGIGGIAAHLFLKGDPVEARCEELISQLDGDFRKHAERALSLYRQCGESLQALPREAAREELARSLQKMTRDAVELAAEWTGVETALQDEAQRELKKEIVDLEQQAAAARDSVAKRQLQIAAASLKEELDRLAELKLKRERISARLRGQVALLERARVALLGMRSGHAHIKAAEMSALARKFNALATAQSDEAKVAHEVATGTELALQEAELAAAVKVAEGIARPDAPAPVQDETQKAPENEPTPKVRA
jgi:beta-galactosidase/beta-glucuronidase